MEQLKWLCEESELTEHGERGREMMKVECSEILIIDRSRWTERQREVARVRRGGKEDSCIVIAGVVGKLCAGRGTREEREDLQMI